MTMPGISRLSFCFRIQAGFHKIKENCKRRRD